MMSKRFSTVKLAILLPFGLALSACGSGSNNTAQQSTDTDPVTPSIQPSAEPTPQPDLYGRLAIADANQPNVALIDLANMATIADISLQNPASALYRSPQSGYAVVVQRKQNLVEFIDSGITGSQTRSPSLLDYKIDQALPTHFDVTAETAALFIDGDSTAGLNAGFVLLSDTSIKQGKALAEHQFNHAMHGTAQIRGEFALTTLRSEDSTSTLPDTVVLLHQHDDHYHEETVFADLCPGLHGSTQGPNWTVFGCEDGVLAIEQSGDAFASVKIPNLEGMDNVRIGTLKGSQGHDKFLGLTRSQQAFLVDPASKSMTEIAWRDNADTRYLAYTVDHHQDHFLVLDNQGYLNVFEIEDDFKLVARPQVFAAPPALGEGQKIYMTTSGSQNTVFIANQGSNQLIAFDLDHHEIDSTIDLAFTPAHLAWVGIPQTPTEHHH
ncbi:hypothetical protein [Motilimonas eburnea]|uniref:hypothetical protein n=1 Tax=Motilimonas eburnea TaxID=1737488 RepID=UPI001E2D1CF9|nr:hypothetical protein [Motilimonas eburnea]MCE2570070.1 hypothetical protein [Motilimonas eburnea]